MTRTQATLGTAFAFLFVLALCLLFRQCDSAPIESRPILVTPFQDFGVYDGQ